MATAKASASAAKKPKKPRKKTKRIGMSGPQRGGAVVPDVMRYHEIARELMAGGKLSEIAKRSGFSMRTIWNVRRDPEFQAILWEYQEAAARATAVRMAEKSGRAMDVLAELLESDDKRIKLKAAETILKHAIPERKYLKHEHVNKAAGELDELEGEELAERIASRCAGMLGLTPAAQDEES